MENLSLGSASVEIVRSGCFRLGLGEHTSTSVDINSTVSVSMHTNLNMKCH